MAPLISICIPAYKNVEYLKRLLDSIATQTFRDFEVIITDDSNDNSVYDYINSNNRGFLLSYNKNEKPLGSPENWNAAVRRAKGDWIKIMHHDDWFSSNSALDVFVQNIKEHPSRNFFFCSYQNKYEDGKIKNIVPPNALYRKLILKHPPALLSSNIIGPPSVTIYKNDTTIFFDGRLKWLVDIDFYITYLRKAEPFYIGQSLINIGIHEDQVTKHSFLRPEIEIPEHLIVLNKIGKDSLKNIWVYDAFWRLVRNLKITTLQELSVHGREDLPIPGKLEQIIKFQKKLPSASLSFGPFSKIAMFISYLFSGN